MYYDLTTIAGWYDLTIHLIKFKYDPTIYMILNLMLYDTMYNVIMILTILILYHCIIKYDLSSNNILWSNNSFY
jgi:hypothetical protein